MSFPAVKCKYEERKEERKSEGPAARDIFIPRCPRLCIQQSQMQTAQIKSKQCKSRENSANQEKTVPTKSKQCKSNANDANQTQAAQIKNKQCKLGDAPGLVPQLSGPRPPRQRAAGLAGPVAPSRIASRATASRRYRRAAARQRAAGTKRARTVQWPDPAARASAALSREAVEAGGGDGEGGEDRGSRIEDRGSRVDDEDEGEGEGERGSGARREAAAVISSGTGAAAARRRRPGTARRTQREHCPTGPARSLRCWPSWASAAMSRQDRAEIRLGQRQKDAAALSPDGSGAGPAGQRVHCPACSARQRPGSGTKTMGKERLL